jgi:hypothetical protein
MHNHLLLSALLMMTLCGFTPALDHQKELTIRVTLEKITCHSADDHGGSEEIYGKLWVLNLNTYGSVSAARDAFKFGEVLKSANASSSIWERDRDHFLTLRKGEEITEGDYKDMFCESGTKLIIFGDLDERDYKRDPDDMLEQKGTINHGIINTNDLATGKKMTLVFKSGGTNVSMTVHIAKVN